MDDGEELIDGARREFREETGTDPIGELVALTSLKQPSGKLVHAWALCGDIDAAGITSNTFSMEWPPRSGKQQQFPEVDRGEWFAMPIARQKILPGQLGFLDELERRLRGVPASGAP